MIGRWTEPGSIQRLKIGAFFEKATAVNASANATGWKRFREPSNGRLRKKPYMKTNRELAKEILDICTRTDTPEDIKLGYVELLLQANKGITSPITYPPGVRGISIDPQQPLYKVTCKE